MAQYNIGPQDNALLLSTALPAAGLNVLTGVLDLQSYAPNGDSWRLGRIQVKIPALPENNVVANTITIALQAAPASLTAGAAQVAPLNVLPGVFVTPMVSQTMTLPGVVAGGSVTTLAYFTLAFDANGSPFQFYQFLITVNAAIVTLGEIVEIAFVLA
jgi:hypothetical protein